MLSSDCYPLLIVQMIPPRGCAYIVMVHRQDAYTALKKLSRGSYKVNQKPFKVHDLLQTLLSFPVKSDSMLIVLVLLAN